MLVSVPDHCLSFYLTKTLLNEFAISDGSSVHKSLSVFIDDIVDLFWFPLPASTSWNNLKMLQGFPLFVSTNVSYFFCFAFLIKLVTLFLQYLYSFSLPKDLCLSLHLIPSIMSGVIHWG